MTIEYTKINKSVHRLIPSRYPPILLFEWASSAEELAMLAEIEGLTNDRLHNEEGRLCLVPQEDWVWGEGSTPVMAAFTHPGPSRFSDGRYGVYYAGTTLNTAIAETRYHREQFLSASNEAACAIQMREYIGHVKKPLVNLDARGYDSILDPDITTYPRSQAFAQSLKDNKEWGIYYPSVRLTGGHCVAVFRPPALSIPVQGCHLNYIWDGTRISEIMKSSVLTPQI